MDPSPGFGREAGSSKDIVNEKFVPGDEVHGRFDVVSGVRAH